MRSLQSIVPRADRPATVPRAVPIATLAAVVALVGMLALPSAFASWGAPAATPSPIAGTAHSAHPATDSAAASPAATTVVFNPPCYKIDTGVCVSICNQTEPNIIPPLGSFVSNVEPNSTTDLPLCIKSQTLLNWPKAPTAGANSPIDLNVSGVLWNGDPQWNTYQGDYWHSNNVGTVWTGPANESSNQSGYIYWYTVTISAKASNGAKNFFPGETMTWWIELTYNESNVYIHHESPHFQYTYSGAWPYSPYPGSAQFAGASATFEDVNLTVTPRSPNWNDTVTFVLNTTQADALSNATIGSAFVDVSETTDAGFPIMSGTLAFPVTVNALQFGATSTSVTVPASFAQVPNAIVTFSLTINDVYLDQLTTPLDSYTVNGNGSFLSGVFTDDLNIQSDPSSVINDPLGVAMLQPGQTVNITLTSRNAGTAINSAEIVEAVSYPLLHEVVQVSIPLHRVTSFIFKATLPAVPITTFVNFTVYAWDFTQRLEVSPLFGYYTPDFNTYLPIVQSNSTFFYVFVYDNGSRTWVTGATVQVTGPSGFYNSVGNTSLGLTYPNQTRSPQIPLLLPANASYSISVNDPYFSPAGGGGGPITVTVIGLHTMTARQTLRQGGDYVVVQEANAVVFYLNTTAPIPTSSPPVPGGQLPIAAIVGLVAGAAAAIPLALWWNQIRRRRKEEEKRVTL